MEKKSIGAGIAKLRRQHHLSQSQLGELLGVTNRAVSKWEKGEALPKMETLDRLAVLLDTNVENLMHNPNVNFLPRITPPRPEKKQMTSLRELFRIGMGPSSSHTIGPDRAAQFFRQKFPDADAVEVTLYGSLALAGKALMTDQVLEQAFFPLYTSVEFDRTTTDLPHPNTMLFRAFRNKKMLGEWQIASVGGGAIEIAQAPELSPAGVYSMTTFEEIAQYCKKNNLRLWEYVEKAEGREIWNYLASVWNCMKESIAEGLHAAGELSGGLHVQRKAGYLYRQRHIDESAETRENRLVCAYAFAVSEQNAAGGKIVTAPTCGSSGVMPAVLKYAQDSKQFTDLEILHALATGGLIGNLIKTNASISGAECGCQAEIGSACSMAAAALGELYGMDIDQIEYSAEVALEHHLGLTCDPIAGLVQIPCIERNAVAAMRAINATSLANFLTYTRRISFDMVVNTMYQTGKDMPWMYRETAIGGLAKEYSDHSQG